MQVINDKSKSLGLQQINSQCSSMRQSQGQIFIHPKKS
jgi:hypothetical protein